MNAKNCKWQKLPQLECSARNVFWVCLGVEEQLTMSKYIVDIQVYLSGKVGNRRNLEEHKATEAMQTFGGPTYVFEGSNHNQQL